MYIYPQTFEDGYDIALDLGLRGISINNDIITKEQIELAHSQGIFVTLWGVRIKSGNIDAVAKNPDMIQTDNVDHLVKYLSGT
jgi:glycerophosphoryl diester phosphodiesterase